MSGASAAVKTLSPRAGGLGSGAARAWLGIGAVAAWFVVALAAIGVGLYASGHAFAGDPSGARAIDLLPAAVAALLLLTIKPYGHAWVQPGPRLINGEHPDLFAVLDEAADAATAPRFDEVYLDGSAETRIVQRDGAFGLGGHRALVIGTALLEVLTTDQLRSRVAHEAFRFEGRDNKLAALVERSRARIRAGLGEVAGGKGGLTTLPFKLYAGFFIEATTALSRTRTLEADAAVAAAFGARPLADSLRLVPGLPLARAMYASQWAGRGGPVFANYILAGEVDRQIRFALFKDEDLQNRIAALNSTAAPSDERQASSLVGSFEPLARRVSADWMARRTGR